MGFVLTALQQCKRNYKILSKGRKKVDIVELYENFGIIFF